MGRKEEGDLFKWVKLDMTEERKYEYPLLLDPKQDRVIKEVVPPPQRPPPKTALFPAGKAARTMG